MNIGIFTDTYTPHINGVVVSINMLVKELRAKGHNVYIFSPNIPQKAENADSIKTAHEFEFKLPSIPLIFSKEYRFAFSYFSRLHKKAKDLDLDIIHTHTEFALGFSGKKLAKKFGIPHVHTYHTMWESYAHYITRTKNDKINKPAISAIKKFSNYFCNSADTIIAPSEKTKKALLSYGIKKNIKIIPTGIDLDPFKKSLSFYEMIKLKQELNIKLTDRVVVFVGRIAKEKSIDVIIDEFSKVIKKISNVKLLIVGDGPERSSLEEYVKDLGLESHIVFAGRKPWEMIPKFYKIGELFINASTTETQGLTFIEAMAAGIPVVARYDDNLISIIKNDFSGKLFYRNEELAENILELLENKKLRQTIIGNAQIIAEEYSSIKYAEKVEFLYNSLIPKDFLIQ